MSALRGKSWRRVGSKVYCHKADSADPWSLIEAYRRILPTCGVFVGRTAAWMHRLDVQPSNPVQVALPAHVRIASRAGLEVRHCDLDGEVQLINGVPATTIERTLLDICARSSSVDALVVLDMAVLAGHGLGRYAENAKGRPGAALLRGLAPFAAPAESPMETRLRWMLIQAGLPIPEVQTDLYDGEGRFVGRADLYYPAIHLVVEFDGANHRERLVSDDRRQNALVGAGYRVLRFTTADLYGRPQAVVAQVEAACSDTRARDTPRSGPGRAEPRRATVQILPDSRTGRTG